MTTYLPLLVCFIQCCQITMTYNIVELTNQIVKVQSSLQWKLGLLSTKPWRTQLPILIALTLLMSPPPEAILSPLINILLGTLKLVFVLIHTNTHFIEKTLNLLLTLSKYSGGGMFFNFVRTWNFFWTSICLVCMSCWPWHMPLPSAWTQSFVSWKNIFWPRQNTFCPRQKFLS